MEPDDLGIFVKMKKLKKKKINKWKLRIVSKWIKPYD